MRILVTGGGGFIGLHLARRLMADLGESDELVLADLLSRHGRDRELVELLADDRVTLVEVDLTLPGAGRTIGGAFDHVYHLAAMVGVGATMTRPAEVTRTNTLSAIEILDWAADGGLVDGGRLLFASTSEVYSSAEATPGGLAIPSDESCPAVLADPSSPRSAYAASKILGETYTHQLVNEKRLDAVVVRYHNVYGPRMGMAHVVPQVLDRLDAGETPFVRYGADQTRSFCYVDDAVEATRRVMISSEVGAGDVVHIGDGRRETSIGELYEILFDVTGITPSRIVDRDAPPGSPERRCPDTSVLERKTGFAARVDLEEGLRRTRAWYASRSVSRPAPAAGVERTIPLSVPTLGPREVAAAARCVAGGWISAAGPDIDALGARIAKLTNRPTDAVVPVSSGSAGLHLALVVAGIRPGDMVLVPSLTFVGSANPIVHCGARPVILDVDGTGTLDPVAVERFLDEECARDGDGVRHIRTGARVAAMIPVDLLGHVADHDRLEDIGRRRGLAVIDDAAEAIGASRDGRPAGSFGDFAVFSFNGNKTVTGGSGGALICARSDDAALARHLSTQARTGTAGDATEYVHDAIGFNFRMSNLTACVAMAQLERIDELVGARRAVAAAYREAAAGIDGVEFFEAAPGVDSSHWLSAVRVGDRRAIARALAERRIQSRPIFAPLHLQPAMRGALALDCPVAEKLWRELLCLPSSAHLTDRERRRVIDALAAVETAPQSA